MRELIRPLHPLLEVIRRAPRGRSAIVLALLALALVIRLAVAVDAFGSPQTGDPLEYDQRAQQLAAGNGFGSAPSFMYIGSHPRLAVAGTEWPAGGPTAYRPPLFPLLLGGLYAVTGPSTSDGRLLQALIGTGIVALTGLIAFQLWGWRVASVALGISAVFAPSVLLGRDLLSEPLFVMLMLMAVAAALDCRRASAGWRRPLLAGVLCGLAVLTRSAGLTLVPCIAFLVWNGRPRLTRRALIAPAIVLAAAMLTVAPWTVRNALVMHRFIPVTDQGGYTLAGVYNRSAEHDQLTPWLWRSPQEDPQNRRIMDSANAKEAAISSQLGTAAVRFLGDHPTAVLGVLLWNSIRLADLDPGREQAAIAYDFHVDRRWARLAVILLLVTGALAVAGALLRAARTAPIAFWLIPLTFWLSTAAIQSGMRFRSPIDPFLIMLTSLALTSGWTRWTAPSERPAEGDR